MRLMRTLSIAGSSVDVETGSILNTQNYNIAANTVYLGYYSSSSGTLNLGSAIEGNPMRLVLLVVLIVLLLGALPTWPYSTGWGYYPSGGLGLVLLIVVVLALMGRL